MSKRTVSGITLTLLLIGMLTLTFNTEQAESADPEQYGPKTDNLLIHIYDSPDVENWDLESCTLDINDWPLAKGWIDRWVSNPRIMMKNYTAMNMFQFDINNKRWPTGCPTHEDEFFETCELCRAARCFRYAIAYMTDKDKILSEILKDYGYRLDLPIPPGLSSYRTNLQEIEDRTDEDLIKDYSQTKAIKWLERGGFEDWDSDGYREWSNDGGTTYEELPQVKFFIRMDEPYIMSAGLTLATELQSVGIPVEARVTERTLCYKNVMVIYDYHLYTGGWGDDWVFNPDISLLHDFYHSSRYYYPMGWSQNYPGYLNSTFDYYAEQVKYSKSVAEARVAANMCGYVFAQSCPTIPLWSSRAVKAYKTGWTGIVNDVRWGIDNRYSFLNASKTDDDTIDWGFKSDIEQLNVISSKWIFDMKVLWQIYDCLMGYNPFHEDFNAHWLATSYEVGTWTHPDTGEKGTTLTFNIRSNVLWHDATPFTPADVKFTIDFMKTCGPFVASTYPAVEDVNKTETHAENPSLGPMQVKVYMNHESIWALHRIGTLPIINQRFWGNIQDDSGRTWIDPDFDPLAVLRYDPAEDDVDGDGTPDLAQDGTGPWIFDSYARAIRVNLVANRNFYFTQSEIEDILGLLREAVTPTLSASVSPLSASAYVGEPLTFTSIVTGGESPYSYQWYLDGNPVSGATSSSWTFTPTKGRIYQVYLKVTDDKGNAAQSETARITVKAIPVGGYTYPIEGHATTKPLMPYLALIAILTVSFTIAKRRKKQQS